MGMPYTRAIWQALAGAFLGRFGHGRLTYTASAIARNKRAPGIASGAQAFAAPRIASNEKPGAMAGLRLNGESG